MTVESLTPMTDAELLSAIKSILNISGEHFDMTLQLYIDEVKAYLVSAGVYTDVLGSTLAVGCIARGVSDLWNYGNGDTKLSEYFYQRADQLRSIQSGYNSKNVSVQLLGSIVKNTFVVQEETSILNIGIDTFDRATDSLAFYVNGLKFDASRYIVYDNNTVHLSSPVIAGTAIEFIVTKLEAVNNG